MDEYIELVKTVLQEGEYKENRTDVDTISYFNYNYTIDLSDGFPLLTTKKMNTFRWDSMMHELVWYLSGEHHIRNLREKTGIWDAWADEDYNLPSAYGRFWRRYPVPQGSQHLDGEDWFSTDSEYVTEESEGRVVFDQLQYVVDALRDENPNRGPNSRRLVVNAWHPSNAQVSSLPPCHYSFVFNVANGKLNTHLTQRSADIALGVPFNIAAYSLLTNIVAEIADLEVGEFGHSLVDAHIYCGSGDRGAWYQDNLSEMQQTKSIEEMHNYVENNNTRDGSADHVPKITEQVQREPLGRSEIELHSINSLDDVEYDKIELNDYDSHESVSFDVAN